MICKSDHSDDEWRRPWRHETRPVGDLFAIAMEAGKRLGLDWHYEMDPDLRGGLFRCDDAAALAALKRLFPG